MFDLLLTMNSELLFPKALEKIKEGLKINGIAISSIRYADDKVLIAATVVALKNSVKNSECELMKEN